MEASMVTPGSQTRMETGVVAHGCLKAKTLKPVTAIFLLLMIVVGAMDSDWSDRIVSILYYIFSKKRHNNPYIAITTHLTFFTSQLTSLTNLKPQPKKRAVDFAPYREAERISLGLLAKYPPRTTRAVHESATQAEPSVGTLG